MSLSLKTKCLSELDQHTLENITSIREVEIHVVIHTLRLRVAGFASYQVLGCDAAKTPSHSVCGNLVASCAT